MYLNYDNLKPAVTGGGYLLLRNNYPIPHVSWLRETLKNPYKPYLGNRYD